MVERSRVAFYANESLIQLTVQSIRQALAQYAQDFTRLYVCGGGALNDYLLKRLRLVMPHVAIETTDSLGIPVMQVEAAAFAWLAKQCMERVPLTLEKITGARGSRVLGAVYPA
jgi:anhydro-N-acetylmuramic acid kinase